MRAMLLPYVPRETPPFVLPSERRVTELVLAKESFR